MVGRFRLGAGLATGVLAVSWAAILVRLAAAPALSVAAWRLVVASVPALAWAALRHRGEWRALPVRERWRAAGAGLALAAHFATWIGSLRLTSVAASVALVTTQPVWVALFSAAFLGERVGRRTALGIALSLAGGLLVAGADLGSSARALAGDALAVAGAVFAALYFVAGRRARATLSLGAYVGAVYPVAALALLAAAALAGEPLSGFSRGTWTALLLLGLVPQLLGHSLLNWSLRWLPAPLVAVAILAEPVVSTLLAIPVLGERPGPGVAAGGLLTLCGVYLAATGTEARPG
jgi:drug/metabolite transporter (DMT)-like permease